MLRLSCPKLANCCSPKHLISNFGIYWCKNEKSFASLWFMNIIMKFNLLIKLGEYLYSMPSVDNIHCEEADVASTGTWYYPCALSTQKKSLLARNHYEEERLLCVLYQWCVYFPHHHLDPHSGVVSFMYTMHISSSHLCILSVFTVLRGTNFHKLMHLSTLYEMHIKLQKNL